VEVEWRVSDQEKLSDWVAVSWEPSECVGSRFWLPAAAAARTNDFTIESISDYRVQGLYDGVPLPWTGGSPVRQRETHTERAFPNLVISTAGGS